MSFYDFLKYGSNYGLLQKQEELKQQQLNQQKQAISQYIQTTGQRQGFTDAEGPPDVTGRFQQQLTQLPGLLAPQQADTTAALLAQSPQALAQFVTSQTVPQGQKIDQILLARQQAIQAGVVPSTISLNDFVQQYSGKFGDDQLQRQDKTFSQEKDLRADYQKNLRPFADVQNSYLGARATLQKTNGPAAIASVVQFVKTLDPTSIVRESESGAVIESSGLPASLMGRLNQLMGRGLLTPEIRQDLSDTLHSIYLAKEETAKRQVTQYQGLASSYGHDPKKVLTGLGLSDKPITPLEIIRAEDRQEPAGLSNLFKDANKPVAYEYRTLPDGRVQRRIKR